MKELNLKLVGMDGNAFMLLGTFSKQARREGWSSEELDKVLAEAKSGDYAHLLSVLGNHCKNGGF